MNLIDLREIAKYAKELRAAGVLQLKMPELELTLAPADTAEPRANEDDEETKAKVAPTAVRAALDFLQSGGRGNAPQ